MVVQNMNLETQHICIVHDKIKVQNFCMDMEVVNPVPDLGRKFEARYKDQTRSSVCPARSAFGCGATRARLEGISKVPYVVQKTRRFQIAYIRHEILTVRRMGVPQTVTFSAPAHHRTQPLPTTPAHIPQSTDLGPQTRGKGTKEQGGRGRRRLPQFPLAACHTATTLATRQECNRTKEFIPSRVVLDDRRD